MKKDIETPDDIKLLVDAFYQKVNTDDLLAPVFNQFAQVAWEHHLPVMYSFWSSLLLGSNAYKGRPFPVHLRLPLRPEHFSRWLSLFEATVDELFKGETASLAKEKALHLARIFQLKMGFIPLLHPQQN